MVNVMRLVLSVGFVFEAHDYLRMKAFGLRLNIKLRIVLGGALE